MHKGMRTTVTIRDDLFEEADRAAARLGISRSRLVHQALERYLAALREETLTEQVNATIEKHPHAGDRSFERYVARVWAQDMGDDEW